MNNVQELANACCEANVKYQILDEHHAKDYLNRVLKKFNPHKTSGHLAIGHGNEYTIPLEPNEFTYSEQLPEEEIFIFFDQDGKSKNSVIVIDDGRKLCNALECAYGMEYFFSNKNMDYLVAVNWYAIEATTDLFKSV